MADIKYPINKSLGAEVKAFPETQYNKVVEIIDAVNALVTAEAAEFDLTSNQNDALDGASSPSATNVFATMSDLGTAISSGVYAAALDTATGYAILSGTTLTLTSFSAPSIITTGNIGETTLAGVAPIFGTGSDLGTTGLATAKASVLALYNTLKALPGTAIITPSTLWADDYGSGVGVFVPGVYTTASAIGMTASKSITLNGAGDYIFVSTGGAITFGANDTIVLTNGATAERVFWVANNAITTGANDVLFGNFMSGAAGAITIGSTNVITGRLLSPVAVTIDGTATTLGITSTSTISAGSFLAPSGTALVPSYSFTSDPDTGIYNSGANQVAVSTNGTVVAIFNSSGALVAGADNTFDIGNGASDYRDINLYRNVAFRKALAHSVAVDDSTVAASVGGALTLKAGAGNTSGVGGNASVIAGNSGATAGAEGGDVILTPGTTTSTTASATILANSNIIEKPLNTASVATGAVITGKQLVDGYIAATGATGTLQLPTAADITTAIGASPIGTTFLFTVNASAMTAGNTATVTVNTNVTFLKQFNSTDVATPALATIIQTAGTHVGTFRCTFDTATTVVVQRVG